MQSIDRIINKAKADRKCKFTSLMHHISEENLKACFRLLQSNKACGIDNVTKSEYGSKLESNLKKLAYAVQSKEYRPKPVKRVYIPKPGKSERRPLGLPSLEDKIVQTAAKQILEAIYEPVFMEFSYGFRPKRSCHHAIKALDACIMTKPINYVVEVDIRKFFDNVDHKWLMRCLKERISDPNFLMLIQRFLKAGVMDAGEFQESDTGTPQGGVVSPVLANIYLHYILDIWFEKKFKPHCRGYAEMIRYCDDFVVCCEYQEDAEAFLSQLNERFEKFGLRVAEEKTQMIKFGKKEWALAEKQGRKCGSFNFLGFTMYGRKSRKGFWVLGQKTSKIVLSRSIKRVQEFLKTVRNKFALLDWWKDLTPKINGHINYFGISGNYRSLKQFCNRVKRLAFKWINRRSQKESMDWKQFLKFLKYNPLPRPCIKVVMFKF